MSQIKIDYEEVRNLARTYDEAEENIKEVLLKLERTQASLQAIWEGQAFNQFDLTYSEFKPKVNEFSQFLGSIGDQLRENARIMQETDEQLMSANKLR